MKLFCDWIEASTFFQSFPLDQAILAIDFDDIFSWINAQRSNGIAERTINNREVLVQGMYNWLTTDEAGCLIEQSPWHGGRLTRQPHNPLPRFITSAQLIKLLNGLHNECQRVAAHFMYDTGVRVSELIRLTNKYLPNEDDWPDNVNYYPLLVPGSKSHDGSPYKFRYTIISRPMLARVRRYHSALDYKLTKSWGIFDTNKPTFLNSHGQSLSYDSVYQGLKAAWARQGGDERKVSPHRLRHGTAFSVLQSEFGKKLLDNLLVLKGMLGHENIKTTEKYGSIPISALQSLFGHKQIRLRYQEAQEIFDATYLPQYKHVEKRGHGKCLKRS